MDKANLLSPNLKRSVERKLRWCIEKASERWPEHAHRFTMPELRFDLENTDAGRAHFEVWMIQFNLILLVENRRSFIRRTVPHEFAHLVTHVVFPPVEGKIPAAHGPEWEHVMTVLNTPPKRQHTYDCSSVLRKRRQTSMRARVKKLIEQLNSLPARERAIVLKSLKEA